MKAAEFPNELTQAAIREAELVRQMEQMRTVMSDLLETEAAYRSAMIVYAGSPDHPTRIRADRRWFHAKQNAKTIINQQYGDDK